MSNTKQDKKAGQSPPDPVRALREMYDQFWKQTAEQWDEVARNPQVLSLMAANLNQSLELKARVQEMVVGLLRTMNMPTREDLAAVNTRLDQISTQLANLDRKVAGRAPRSKTKTQSKPPRNRARSKA